jgi:biopolymer transport protein ExbD
MSPLIDVVFLMLIYFVLTFVPKQVEAHLGACAPSGGPTDDPPKPLFYIVVEEEGYNLMGNLLTLEALELKLDRLSIDPDQVVVLVCKPDSRHEGLIGALDACRKAGMNHLFVVSGK